MKKIVLYVMSLFLCSLLTLPMEKQTTQEAHNSANDLAKVYESCRLRLELLHQQTIKEVSNFNLEALSDKISADIDMAIVEQKPEINSLWSQLFLKVSESESIQWLSAIDQAIPAVPQSEKIYELLHQKNKYFRSFVDVLVEDECKNLAAVDGTTIDQVVAIAGPRWGEFPQILKNYIFGKAKDEFFKDKNIEHTYVLKGHTEKISSIDAYSEYIVSGSDDGTVRVWNWKTGLCEHVIQLNKKITCVGLDRDKGEHVAIATNSPIVQIWNIKTATWVDSLDHGSEVVQQASYGMSRDCNNIITCNGEKWFLYLWDINKKSMLAFPLSCIMKSQMGFCSRSGENYFIKRCDNDVYYIKKSRLFTLCKFALENNRDSFAALICSSQMNNLDLIEKNELLVLEAKSKIQTVPPLPKKEEKKIWGIF